MKSEAGGNRQVNREGAAAPPQIDLFPADQLMRAFARSQDRELELEADLLEQRENALGREASPQELSEWLKPVPIGSLDLSESGVIQTINPAGMALLEIPPEGAVGQNFDRFVSPGDSGRVHALIMQCSQLGGRASAGVGLVSSRGNPIEARLLASSIRRSAKRQVRMWLVANPDFKLAEDTLFRLASYPVLNPNPILEFYADGSLKWCNQAAHVLAASLGFDRAEKMLPDRVAEIVRECLETGASRVRQEVVLGNRHVYWSFFPILGARVVHCYGTDITERLLVEANLRESQKLESVGQLAAGLAHDFNNILTIIQGYTSLLLAQRDLPAEICEPLLQVSSASERATNLTRQLMTFSRKQATNLRVFDLNETVQSFSYLLRRLLGDAITEQYSFAPNLPPIQADPAMVEQIILNLALNARDAMSGGGKLLIDTALVRIDESYRAQNPESHPGTFACLTMTDTGKGINPEILGRIFEPFFTTKESASGLGLSTVYGIVKQHQGWIEVSSQPDGGTTFRVFLPVAAATQEPAPQTAPALLDGNETILVVEDEPALRELVVRQLRRRGYRILQAGSGSEALSIWPQHADEIDLLFTDMVMSDGMTGRDLAETLLAQKPDLKVIYSSGYSLEVVEQDFALRKGAKFLQKPYEPPGLMKLIRSMLDEGKGRTSSHPENVPSTANETK